MNVHHLKWDDIARSDQVALACFRDDGKAVGDTLIEAFKAGGLVALVRLVDALGCMAAYYIARRFDGDEAEAIAHVESQMDKATCYGIADVSGLDDD
jgi:hypothetical protein